MEISQNILSQLDQTREAINLINLDKWTELVDGVRMDLVNLSNDPKEKEQMIARLTPLIAVLKEQNQKVMETLLKASASALEISEKTTHLFTLTRELDRSLERSEEKLSDFPMEGKVASIFDNVIFKGAIDMIAPICSLASKVITQTLKPKES